MGKSKHFDFPKFARYAFVSNAMQSVAYYSNTAGRCERQSAAAPSSAACVARGAQFAGGNREPERVWSWCVGVSVDVVVGS